MTNRLAGGELAGALRLLANALPPGTPVPIPRETLLELLGPGLPVESMNGKSAPSPTWRERLWTCPAETRLGVHEVAEALGRPPSWVYRAVSLWRYSKAHDGTRRKVRRLDQPLPHEHLSGELVFRAGEVRRWMEAQGEGTPS